MTLGKIATRSKTLLCLRMGTWIGSEYDLGWEAARAQGRKAQKMMGKKFILIEDNKENERPENGRPAVLLGIAYRVHFDAPSGTVSRGTRNTGRKQAK